MPGYVMAHGACLCCRTLFSFNPKWVPSHRRAPDLPREPICEACVKLINPRRIANGLPPIDVHPEAYEPCEEGEL